MCNYLKFQTGQTVSTQLHVDMLLSTCQVFYFLVQFNNFDRTTGIYWSYTLFLYPLSYALLINRNSHSTEIKENVILTSSSGYKAGTMYVVVIVVVVVVVIVVVVVYRTVML